MPFVESRGGRPLVGHQYARMKLGETLAKSPMPPCGSWLGYMRMAVAQTAKVDYVVTLPGWEESRGAKVEVELARGLGLPVYPLSTFLRICDTWLPKIA